MRLVQIKLEPNQLLRTGEAFGVRRPGAAFPALYFANGSLKSDFTFSGSKAGKAAPGRRTPKASPASRDLMQIKLELNQPLSNGEAFGVLRPWRSFGSLSLQ